MFQVLKRLWQGKGVIVPFLALVFYDMNLGNYSSMCDLRRKSRAKMKEPHVSGTKSFARLDHERLLYYDSIATTFKTSLQAIASNSSNTLGSVDDFSNVDYSKVKGPEKRGYIRCVGRMCTVKQKVVSCFNDPSVEQIKTMVNVMANIIQEHILNANLSGILNNMNIQAALLQFHATLIQLTREHLLKVIIMMRIASIDPRMKLYCVMVEDMDVRMLINVIKCSGGRAVKVFVVVDEGDGVNEVGQSGNKPVANLCSYKGSNNLIGTFNTPSVPQFHSVAENVNVSYSLIHYVDPENYKYVGDDDVGIYLNDMYGRCVDVPEQEVKGFIVIF
uniref:Uncharacterized protein n=1 Tax=Lactuca sativa TaxID=4236 RepID=A0A9R1V026_LACSA|nr:hypothetical protein LSAT_V11C700343330 [Lactuca sativa]